MIVKMLGLMNGEEQRIECDEYSTVLLVMKQLQMTCRETMKRMIIEHMIDVVNRLSDENEEASSVTYELGVCYLNGIGVKRDEKKAMKYFEQAC